MEILIVLMAIGTGAFFALRFHHQGKGWVWGLLYGLFLFPLALAHALLIGLAAFFDGRGLMPFAKKELSFTKTGAEHMLNGEYDKAISHFNRAIEINPHLPEIYELRGQAYSLQSRFDKAISDFSKAIEIISANPIYLQESDPYFDRGTAWAELNEFARAVEDFTRAIEIKPEADFYLARGQAYDSLSDYDKALEDYEESIGRSPTANAYQMRGDAYLELGKPDEALNDFRNVLMLGQKGPAVHLGLARAHLEKQDIKKAIAEFTQGISSLPDYVEANSDLIGRRRHEDQLNIYNSAVDVMTGLYRGRGICHALLGEYQKAIADFGAAIDLDPKDIVAYHSRGALHCKLENYAQAIGDLDYVTRLNGESQNTFFTRGLAYSKIEDFESGRKDFDRAIRIDADHSDSYIGRGSCHLSLGMYSEAVKDLDVAIDLMSRKGIASETEIISVSIEPSYAYAYRGVAHSLLGHKAAAQRDINEAVALGHDYTLIEADIKKLEGDSKCAEGIFNIESKFSGSQEDMVVLRKNRSQN